MANVPTHVCDACGIRDPFDKYSKEAIFNTLADNHWLRVGEEAYARLKQLEDLELLRPNTSGGYEIVRIPRTLFHSLIEIERSAFHVLPEAVIDHPLGQRVKLCKRCGRGWDSQLQAKRTETPHSANN
jgi:hypothetical protein